MEPQMGKEVVAAGTRHVQVLRTEGSHQAPVGLKPTSLADAVAHKPSTVIIEQVVAVATPVSQGEFRIVFHDAVRRWAAYASRGKCVGRNPHIHGDYSSPRGHRSFSQARLAGSRSGVRPVEGTILNASA